MAIAVRIDKVTFRNRQGVVVSTPGPDTSITVEYSVGPPPLSAEPGPFGVDWYEPAQLLDFLNAYEEQVRQDPKPLMIFQLMRWLRVHPDMSNVAFIEGRTATLDPNNPQVVQLN